jgi:hypothetical protein
LVISKTTYHTLLHSNQKISLEHMAGLEELLNDFPYSQNIRQLYLKALFQNESVKFESELSKTASYTCNRSHLKRFILDDSYEKNEVKQVILTSSPQTVEVATDKKSESIKPVIQDDNVEHPKSLAKDKNTTKKQSTSNTADSLLNDEVLSEAINASILMEVGVENKEVKTPDTKLPRKESQEEVARKKSFIQWIKHYDEEQQVKAIDHAKFKEKATLLIDQFISNQPKIKPKKDFYSPVDMANKSLRQSDEVASETLANILFLQGNPNKAIKMYQSLSLKLPEKKAYFANEIEKIIISKKDKS